VEARATARIQHLRYSEQKRYEALEQLGQWIRQGRLRIIKEHRHSFDQLPQAFIDLLAGRSSGSSDASFAARTTRQY
jgi:NADPH-dependent curcumin reductase CurA